MLALVFEIGDERYAVDARRIVEVVPRPTTRAVPGAPAWIAGVFNRQDDWVPIVDLCRLLTGVDCPPAAGSRVALVDRVAGEVARTVGLLAPGMTRVLELPDSAQAGLHVEGHEFLGPIVATDAQGVQLVEVDRLLPPDVDRLLFGGDVAP
jgi:chemotaxis-related protein WspB